LILKRKRKPYQVQRLGGSEGLLGDYLGGESELGGDNPVNARYNVAIKVNGNTAWLVCDNK